ncbi:MAG: Asp23/Gls24 family envelope stress response protein [Candidatus Omnitrophica bacterium]|nr:Asp23/Gls24 family envelope stress response protein [Candidatus Omnitrophota bacterium]
MTQEESRTDLGLIRIHKNVIASIASLSAMEIEGVKRVGFGGLRSSLMELLGQKNVSAIKIVISKNEDVKVEIPLFIKYGFSIPDIANKVQENVRTSLEKMTNLSIKDININVQGIERG